MQTKIKLIGMREVEKALARVKGATAKNKSRKILREAGEPIARDARARAPRDEHDLVDSIDVSPVLNKAQRKLHPKRSFADVEMHIGAGVRHAILPEFGTFKDAAQPFMRPAWDANKMDTLDFIGARLWQEVEKAAK
tara:strand:+ start:120 stop:530 length:411 start_codon:yes stop_codon:yes gene_type:complete